MERDTPLKVKRLVKFDGEGAVRAYCDLSIGELFLVKGLRIISGRNGLFVSMPRLQGKDTKWYDSVVALTKETKEEVGRVVLAAYHQEDAASGTNGRSA